MHRKYCSTLTDKPESPSASSHFNALNAIEIFEISLCV